MRGAARNVAVLEDVATAVHTRTLAVPEGKHAIDPRLRVQAHHLRAPDRRGRQLLVQPGLKAHLVLLQQRPVLPELLIHRTQRGAAVAGNKAFRVEPGGLIPGLLRQQQPHQRLRAVHVDAASGQLVFVGEGDGMGHAWVLAAHAAH